MSRSLNEYRCLLAQEKPETEEKPEEEEEEAEDSESGSDGEEEGGGLKALMGADLKDEEDDEEVRLRALRCRPASMWV